MRFISGEFAFAYMKCGEIAVCVVGNGKYVCRMDGTWDKKMEGGEGEKMR
jgi:hypothetical protein